MENNEDIKVVESTNEEEVEIIYDFRQQTFWKQYLGNKSDTRGNAYRSALAAGYADSYAVCITSKPWFKRKMRRKSLLNKAERVMDETLDTQHIDNTGKIDPAVLRVKNDTAKFIAKTLGKDKGYTERAEMTGKGGSPLIVMPSELVEKYNLQNLGADASVEPEEINEEE